MTLTAVQREYRLLAAGYDTRWSAYVEATTAMALAHVPTTPATRILDVGCGTGWLLAHATETDPTRVCVGADLTFEMLRRAQQRLRSRATLLNASGDALPLADASVDCVVSTSALHYMRDAASVLGEMRRVLVHGGTLVVTDWCGDFRTMRWLDLALRVVDPAHVRTVRSAALRAAVERAGFSHVTSQTAKIDRFWGIMTVVGRAR